MPRPNPPTETVPTTDAAPPAAPTPAKKTTHPYRVHQPATRLNSERIIAYGSRMGIRG